jgi:transglutaminase-like putative cysteine protease
MSPPRSVLSSLSPLVRRSREELVTAYRLLFAYAPATRYPSRLLLAVPPLTRNQTPVLVDAGPLMPVRILNEASNAIELYDIEPGQKVFREYRITIGARPFAAMVRPDTLHHYTRPTTLLDFGPRVCEIALECKRATERETLRALFDRVVQRSEYRWPPERRGTSAFLETWSGDCGEMSFAMAAVLRRLGIPSRVVVGAFAQPGLKAHAWLEVLDGSSWITVDAALANAKKPHPTGWFDFVPADRVVFSYDCDLQLEGLIVAPRGKTSVDLAFADDTLNWGGSLLNGAVPYLQPGYPLVDEVMTNPLTLPVWDISIQSNPASAHAAAHEVAGTQ